MGSVYQFYFAPHPHYASPALKPEKFSKNVTDPVLAGEVHLSLGLLACLPVSGQALGMDGLIDGLTDGMVE